jgi:NitT/TauT family transport system permease protein
MFMAPNRRAGLRRSLLAGWSLRLGSLAALALGWELFAGRARSLLVPSCGETLSALGRLLAGGQLWSALWISNQAMILGFAAAAVAGILLGLVMGRSRAIDGFFDPYLNILLVTPMSAAVPLVIMVAGAGLAARVLVVFLFSLVPVAINARAGMRTVDPDWIAMARGLGATEGQLWRKVFLRAARPAILLGLRLGLIRAVSGMITIELLLVAVGIGRLILDYQGSFDAGSLYAAVIVVIAEAVFLTQLCSRFEVRAALWTGQVTTE